MNVSIILVHYNTPKLLLNCLKSLYAYTSGISFEVIIIDNASTKRPTPQELSSFKVVWVQNDENIGFGQANNLGAKKAKGDYFFLLNTDTLISSNVIKNLYLKAEKIKNIGILAPRLLNNDGTVQYYGSVLGLWHYIGHKDRDVSFISGAAMFIKKSVFDSVGGFDPNYFFYNEDIDLCLTLKRAGYRLIYSPDNTLIHLGGGSTQANITLKRQAFRSSWYFFKKHYLPCFGKASI